jgi:hypothetical protein
VMSMYVTSRYEDQQMTPAGWYPDPYGTSQQRYWDGTVWTEHMSGDAPPASPPSYVAPTPVTPPWYRRKLTFAVGSVLALIIVGVIGAATGSSKAKNSSAVSTPARSSATSQAAPLISHADHDVGNCRLDDLIVSGAAATTSRHDDYRATTRADCGGTHHPTGDKDGRGT